MNQNEFKDRWLPYEADFFRLAFRLLESEEDAADVVQDVYVKLWNARNCQEGIVSPKGYGLVLIRNLCLDRLRRRKTAPEDVLPDDGAFASPPDEEICTKELVAQVGNLIRDLPDDQRHLLEMKYFQHRDYGEIARRTGLSQVNVRVKISRARKFIKEMILKQDKCHDRR